MPTPNLNYYPMVEPLPGGTAFLDGWETTLAADWNGNEPPAMTDWINLDTVLIQWKAMATVVMEWTSDSKTYRQMVALFPSQGVIRGGMIPGGMANDVPPVSDTGFTVIPAGARVYMPLLARDIQLLVNHAPLTLSYIAQNGEWKAVFSGMFPLRQPTGQQYTLPAIGDGETGLILLCSLTNMGYVVLQEQKLSGSMPWFFMSAGSNGGGNGGGVPS